MITLFIKGFILGLSIAAPIGPIGILCIRTTFTQGFLAGLMCGLGAATSSALYGAIAGFGLTMICAFLFEHRMLISLVGGLFLVYLGVKTMCAQPMHQVTHAHHDSLIKIYFSTLLLTLTNPVTILSYTAAFTTLGIMQGCSNGFGAAISLVIGVFCGALLWWLISSGFVSVFRTKLDVTAMQVINKLSGLLIIGFGVYVLIGLFR